ncbi:isochorismate synthase [Acinetobacter sp. ANC 3813]|uniref:isochorismate synthase n=1 Tax=Acinetobacter sp. ANC 3813 TaxID=1977873 RepID=UPI000A352AFF|nr:isochorismate synthase [Acinetobacter sp. ANC 3813]OTG92143.1 isochorismate synthase [Acinetobacter sp. ANC 3813]
MLPIEPSVFKNMIGITKEDLIEADLAGFVFATPTGTISSKKLLENIQFERQSKLSFADQQQAWLKHAQQQLQQKIQTTGNAELILVGSLPFDNRDLPEMSIAEAKNTFVTGSSNFPEPIERLSQVQATLIPPQSDYVDGVAKLVELMKTTELEKAVLARAIDLQCKQKIPVVELFYQLFKTNPEGYTFALAQDPKKLGWFMGASPELLVAKQNQYVFSNPVAGTLARSADPAEDQAQAERLFASAKDQHEHAVVIEAIADQLSPLCQSLSIPKSPSLIKTQTVWHLATQIKGTLKDPDMHVFDLATILHPTPAVCGQPAPLARQLISELEPFQRNLFAGTMGWSDASGNGAWAVNVRCGRIFEHSARLYAGAGIVEASQPTSELNETIAKFKTMLNALGLDADQLAYQ